MPPDMGHLSFIQNNKVFTKDAESLLGPGTTQVPPILLVPNNRQLSSIEGGCQVALLLYPTPTYSSPSFICDPPEERRGPDTPSQDATLHVRAETGRSFWFFCVNSTEESCAVLPMQLWLVLPMLS